MLSLATATLFSCECSITIKSKHDMTLIEYRRVIYQHLSMKFVALIHKLLKIFKVELGFNLCIAAEKYDFEKCMVKRIMLMDLKAKKTL